MTADELVAAIMRRRAEIVGPDRDPGDITITVQDDSVLVTVTIDKYTDEDPVFPADGIGASIIDALTNCLERLGE